jgi:hypothetical protein
MKYILFFLLFNILFLASAQDDNSQLLDGVLEDVRRFGKQYFAPGSNAMIYSMSSGWTNTAKSKDKWKFEVGLVGNFANVSSNDQKFLLNSNDYNSITFQSGPEVQFAASVLGENKPEIP